MSYVKRQRGRSDRHVPEMRGDDIRKTRDRRRAAPGVPARPSRDSREARRLRGRADEGRVRRPSRDERRSLRAPRRDDRSPPPEGEPAPERGATPRRRKETFVIGKALALTLVLLAFPLSAEEPPAPATPAAPAGVPLSLADATARALANNSDIAIERESFRIVDASLLKADAPYD